MREGFGETLAVARPGLTVARQRTLRSTNAIKSLDRSVERYTESFKRWRGGEMIQLLVFAALLHGEERFRPLGGKSVRGGISVGKPAR